jgi:glutathione S-transferase
MTSTPLKIYGVPLSVHTRKVILAARLKSIAYEIVPVIPVIPDNPPADWRSISPTGLIPALDDQGFILADSTAIVLYLERTRPSPALLPAAAKAYGRALFFDAWAGSALFRSIVHPLFHNQVVLPNIHKRAGDLALIDAALSKALPEAFTFLEDQIRSAFLVGEELSLADLAVASNLLTFHYLGHGIDQTRFPKVHTYFHRHLASALFASALETEKPFVARTPGLTAELA